MSLTRLYLEAKASGDLPTVAAGVVHHEEVPAAVGLHPVECREMGVTLRVGLSGAGAGNLSLAAW